jgi:hypothetical protein
MTQCTVSDRLESYTPQLLAFAPIHGSSSFSGLFLYAALSRIAVMFASDKNRAIKCNKVGRLDCCRIAVRRMPYLDTHSSKIENVLSCSRFSPSGGPQSLPLSAHLRGEPFGVVGGWKLQRNVCHILQPHKQKASRRCDYTCEFVASWGE